MLPRWSHSQTLHVTLHPCTLPPACTPAAASRHALHCAPLSTGARCLSACTPACSRISDQEEVLKAAIIAAKSTLLKLQVQRVECGRQQGQSRHAGRKRQGRTWQETAGQDMAGNGRAWQAHNMAGQGA